MKNTFRYQHSLVWALPIGAAIGAILGPIFLLLISSNYLNYGGLNALAFWMAISAAFGVATGLCALIGGYWRVASRACATDGSPGKRVRDAPVGAALGACIGWAFFVTAVSLVFGTPIFGFIVALFGLVCVVLSALIAGWLVAVDERRASTRMPSNAPTPTSMHD